MLNCLQRLHHPSGNRSRLGMSSQSAQMLNGMTGCVQTLRPRPKRRWLLDGNTDSLRTPSGLSIQSGSSHQLRLQLQTLLAGKKRFAELNDEPQNGHMT